MPLSQRDRRTLIIGGVIMAVMLVAFFVFNSTQSDEVAGPSFAPLAPGSSSGAPTTSGPTTVPSGSGSQTAPPTSPTGVPVFAGARDPFSIPPGLAPTTTTSTSDGTTIPPTDGTTTPPTDGTTTPPTDGTTTPPTVPGGGSSTVIDGHTVVLLDVFTTPGGTQMAQVEVDGHVYNPAVGDSFDAGRFELRSVSGDCASFLYGDQQFALCATSPK